MVLVAHYLIRNSVLLGIGASRQSCSEGLIIQSILHLAALHCAGSNQSLSLSIVNQVDLSLRCRHRDVGLLDGVLHSLGAGVIPLTSGSHLSSTGIYVVGISQGVVSALNQNSVAVLHSNGGFLLCSVVYILSRIKCHVEHCVVVGHDVELSRNAALEVTLTSNGSSISAHVGALVASYLITISRHLHVAGIDAGHLCGLLLLVVHQTGLSQRNGCQRSLTNSKRSRSRTLIVANTSSSHLSGASVQVVLKGQGVVGIGLHHSLAVLHHHSRNECFASIDRRRNLSKHAISHSLGRNNQLAPVCTAEIVVALSHVDTDSYLTGALDGHLASGGVNSGNLGLVRLERQHTVTLDVRLQDEVSVTKGLFAFRGIEQHRAFILVHLKLHLLLARIVSADAPEGGDACAGVGVVREGHGKISTLNQILVAVFHGDIRLQGLT